MTNISAVNIALAAVTAAVASATIDLVRGQICIMIGKFTASLDIYIFSGEKNVITTLLNQQLYWEKLSIKSSILIQ